jgi:hypothetical protein
MAFFDADWAEEPCIWADKKPWFDPLNAVFSA